MNCGGVPVFVRESTADVRVMSRRRPLHTCGVSALEIARIAINRVQNFSGPIGAIARKVTERFSSLFPSIFAFQNQCLAFLCFVDNQILVIEKIVEGLFPPTAYVFNKIDKLVLVAEALPERFDDAIEKFPKIIYQVPILNFAVLCMLSWLDYVATWLIRLDCNNAREKEIVVDASFDKSDHKKSDAAADELIPELHALQDQTSTSGEDIENSCLKTYSPSYKEMLHRGSNKDAEEEKIQISVDPQASASVSVEIGNESEKDNKEKDEGSSTSSEDPILELFETWHT